MAAPLGASVPEPGTGALAELKLLRREAGGRREVGGGSAAEEFGPIILKILLFFAFWEFCSPKISSSVSRPRLAIEVGSIDVAKGRGSHPEGDKSCRDPLGPAEHF